ncbi:MAG: hypothetical protein JXI33_04325 [Candidatus Aminicenantes bacterium]|nr:hypothetical protein [Candidatus Aminicenantes bacterium]
MKHKKKLILFLAISTLIVLGLRAWDDEKLFTTIQGGKGKSNVVLIQDRTGSMCSIIYHPDFNVKDSSLDSYSTVNLSGYTYEGINETSWYMRWYIAPSTILERATYAIGHTFTSTGSDTGTLLVGAEGINFRVGDQILQYNPSDTLDINYQAIGRITAISGPDSNRFFTLTLDDIQGTFVDDYRLHVSASTVTLYSYSSSSHALQVYGDVRNYYDINDYILLYDRDSDHNTSRQAMARITAMSYSRYTGRTTLTLTDINGTISVTSYQDRAYYRRPSETRLVKLYGTTLDQEASNNYRTSYGMDGNRYLKWIFGRANAAQRQQVSDFSTLGYDIDYNGYLRATPVRPDLAYALEPDNSNSSETLLAEWNRVMKDIYPNKVANLQNDPINSTATTINYYNAKNTFINYTTGGFYIKVDAETMLVNSHTPSADPEKTGEGQLTVTRARNNTTAATHLYGAAIMIYNNAAMGIDESTPERHLFSSMQHVVESTGNVDPTWIESKVADFDQDGDTESKPCYRYKRVFTRIQVAREALCDVITAKNKMLKIADLTPAIDDSVSEFQYCNANADFLTRVAPFYIKVSDADNPGSDEIMLVTAHDPVTYTLTVSRGQQGTTACAHDNFADILTFSGARDLVRFGIFTFSSNDNPASKIVDLADFGQKNADGTYKTASYVNTIILDRVNTFRASGGTPLGRALAWVWNYLKPNPGSGTSDYLDTDSGDWEAVDSSTFGTSEKFETLPDATHVSPQGSPMEYWCQENFAVLITDGDATGDYLSGLGVFEQSSQKTAVAGAVITDFFKFNYNRSSYATPWGDTVYDGSEYLTDVAYFLYHQDMFPTKKIKTGTWDYTNRIFSSGTPEADATLYNESDLNPYKQWPGNQNIKTYTVGLCLANAVLPKAAKNGGGVSFTASNYRDLTEAFINIITSVALAQDPMSYTTYAAPKQSITEGKFGYIAHFIPRERPMWEGHLRRYRLGDDGSFPNNIDNPDDTVIVKIDDALVPVKSFQWDATEVLNRRTTPRVVYTSIPTGSIWSATPADFMGSAVGTSELGVSTSAQVTQIKNFIRNFNKADGIDANSDYNDLYRLGETFHFNPQLVGYPLVWKAYFDPSYKSFYERYSSGSTARTEVVYTGCNDGKLHCFQSSTADGIEGGTELWSYVPFALLKKLQVAAFKPFDSTDIKHTYYVDGKSLVKDIKVPQTDGSYLNDYRDWKTGLFFGLGIGGRAYCALDITNPKALKVLWETQDDAETVSDGHMGFTEAKPIQVNMYGGTTLGYFPGMILAGGYNASEVQATDMSAQEWQRREGKALYIVNADSGAVIKKFAYGDSDSNSSSYCADNDFLTAMTAAPAVLDKNNDGIADVIYFAESGDYRVASAHGAAIWKIDCYGDPVSWMPQKIYQAPAGQTIFVSPSLAYDKDFRVWVMFGTGRRSQPAEGLGTGFTNLTGQFVAFIDDGSTSVRTNANLHLAEETSSGITSVKTGPYTIDDGSLVKKGFYFNFLQANEIMFEPQPLYVNSKVYFMTFRPLEGVGSSGSSDDPCGGNSAVNGSHFIYQFKLTSSGNTFVIGDFLFQSGKILGYGPIDDEFTIYVGAGVAGDFKSIESQRKRDDLKDSYRALLWKEDKK